MNILVVAATRQELSPINNYLELKKYTGPHNVQTLITGVGILLTTYQLAQYLQQHKTDFVFQVGIGGGFDKKTPLGSVLAVMEDTVGDLAVEENKDLKTIFDLGLAKPGQKPFKHGWLVNKYPEVKKNHLQPARGITVNKITTSADMIKLYREKYQPDIESMEGAALHYVCLMQDIGFLQLRAISNYIGDRNKQQWKINEAIENVNEVCMGLLNVVVG